MGSNPRKRAPRPGEGRPSAFKPEYAARAEELCRSGATDEEIADDLGVTQRTIHRWSAKYPKFCLSLKAGKDVADDRVERSLYHRAVGYTFDAVKIFQVRGKALIVPYKEHVPPDIGAAAIWLKNRRRNDWRDRQEIEHLGEVPVKIVVKGGLPNAGEIQDGEE